MRSSAGHQLDPAPKLRGSASSSLFGAAFAPGDKSLSHRALILASLAEGRSVIHGLLDSADVRSTAIALQKLGSRIERCRGNWNVIGGGWQTPEQAIDCGNSGTGARLLIGAAAGRPVIATFTGDSSLRSRPMGRVVEPLLAMGADIERRSFLPIKIRGGRLQGLSYKSPVPSAQVKSAILLAGLSTSEPVEIFEPVPTRDHSERLLRHFGCEVEMLDRRRGRLVRLGQDRTLVGRHVVIPGDPSAAAFPLVAALIVPGSDVTMKNVLESPLRNGLLATLREMGANIELQNRRSTGEAEVADVRAASSALKGVRVPASRAASMIDEYPLLAVAAAFAEGETLMEGLSELRFKESDRLAAIEEGLRRSGVNAEIRGDCLRVVGTGAPPRGGTNIATHGDHRIAMAFLVLGLASRRPVTVDRPEMIATSFPDFSGFMAALGADIAPCEGTPYPEFLP